MKIKNRFKKLRRAVCSKSLKLFARTYFKEYCTTKNSRFHEEVYGLLELIESKRNQRVAIAAPREHAKSTMISLIFVLWVACYKMDKCIVLVSSISKQAEDLLSDVRDAIRQNEFLMEDFPDVCEPPNPKWRKDEIILKNSVRILAAGTESELRGKRYKQYRPSLIILDDVEQTGDMFSQEVRERLLSWFVRVILHLGSKTTNIIVTGTIHHYDSLLYKLTSETEFPGWIKRIYKAVESWPSHPDLWDSWTLIYRKNDEHEGQKGPEAAKEYFLKNQEDMMNGVKVLWPEKESFYDLMIMRERGSEASFYTEKQNEPLGGSSFWFPAENLVYWDDKFNSPDDLLRFLGDNKIILGAIDPSMGNSRKSDFSAIVTVCKDRRNGTMYVIAADIGRWQPDDLITRVINVFCKWGHHRIGFEENGFQKLLGVDIIKNSASQGKDIPISFIKNTDRKENRITRLQPMIKQGHIQFSRSYGELIREILHYPKGAHDDGIDALSMILDISSSMLIADVKKQGAMFKELAKPYVPGTNKVKWEINPRTGHRRSFDDPFGLLSV